MNYSMLQPIDVDSCACGLELGWSRIGALQKILLHPSGFAQIRRFNKNDRNSSELIDKCAVVRNLWSYQFAE